MPWAVLGRLPVLEHAIAVSFALFVVLTCALIVALWLVPGGLARWALAALVVASFLPDVGNPAWQTSISDPAFFSTGRYRSHLDEADNVLTIPVWGPNERWQAATEFDFKLSAGYLGNPFPPSYSRYPSWDTFLTGRLTPGLRRPAAPLRARQGVTAVVVDKRSPGPWKRLFASLGVRPVDTGGVLFYRLRAPG